MRETELWSALWVKPQALMWERYGQQLEVALYVRRLVEAEEPGSFVNLSTLVRQMADSLGLTTPGMRANRWRITAEEAAPVKPAGRGRQAPVARSSRSRLKVVPSDGA
ncbi:hypothetical protein [Streptomyces sp. NPDC047972]|uniref:hypothetical protein n=1 Tax=Streptomyces sp. NPDC047972 TaxID=3365493 RepID=UPI0037134C49